MWSVTLNWNEEIKERIVSGIILPEEYSILHRCEQTVGVRVHGDDMLAVWVICQGFIDPVDKSHFLFICGQILQIRHKQFKQQAQITNETCAQQRAIKSTQVTQV